MKTITLTNPVTQVIQPEITREITAFTIQKYEDTGTQLLALTDLGYIVLFEGEAYPIGGIFATTAEQLELKCEEAINNL